MDTTRQNMDVAFSQWLLICGVWDHFIRVQRVRFAYLTGAFLLRRQISNFPFGPCRSQRPHHQTASNQHTNQRTTYPPMVCTANGQFREK